MVSLLSRVRLFATKWTIAHQAPLSWREDCPWDFPGKNTEVGCHFLLQEIFPTQGSNKPLLHWQTGSLLLSYQGSHYLYIRILK